MSQPIFKGGKYMNCWIGIGRLTKKPELRKGSAEDSYVARATLAIDRDYKKDGSPSADFIHLTVYGKRGKTFATYLDKGNKISVRGRITTDSYEKDGKTIPTWCVVVDQFEFLEKKSDKNDSTKDTDGTPPPAPSTSTAEDDAFFAGLQNMSDDDLPWA